MAPPKGNEYWKLARLRGDPFIFVTPEDLWQECVAYFEWAEANPLVEDKVFCTAGEVTYADVNHPRPFTLNGLQLFLGIAPCTWHEYEKRPGYDEVCKTVRNVIYEQKFAYTAVGFFNAKLMMAHLSIVEKSNVEHTGRDGGPIETVQLSAKEKAARINALIKLARQREQAQADDEPQ